MFRLSRGHQGVGGQREIPRASINASASSPSRRRSNSAPEQQRRRAGARHAANGI